MGKKPKVEQGTVLLTGGRVPTSWTLLQNVDGVHMRWTVVTQGGNTFQCCRNQIKVQKLRLFPQNCSWPKLWYIAKKSWKMTDRPGQWRDSETVTNGPRRCDDHRSNNILNGIYKVIQITECVNTSERVTDTTCYIELQNVTPHTVPPDFPISHYWSRRE